MDTDLINKLLGITESYQAPEKMLKLMLDDEKRKTLFKEFLKHKNDMSYEWFRSYFENEHSDRKVKKQDFTPDSISILMSKIIGDNNHYYEIAAGTGSILIKEWDKKHKLHEYGKFNPRIYWYQVEELSDRAIPFLIFNMAIRGMNGVAMHGDSLTREFKDIYFIRNDTDDSTAFSEVYRMPKTEALKEELNVKEWR